MKLGGEPYAEQPASLPPNPCPFWKAPVLLWGWCSEDRVRAVERGTAKAPVATLGYAMHAPVFS